MKKLIFIILGLLFIPVIIVVIFVAIPVLILFVLFMKIFTGGRRKTVSGKPPQTTKVSRHDDIYDIDCEVVDEDDSKK